MIYFLGANEEDAQLFEYGARNQITLWGPTGEIMDYAGKQWSGLISDYYFPRWKLFFDYLSLDLIDPETFPYDQEKFKQTFIQEIGTPFTLSRKTYPDEPSGNFVELVQNAYKKWRFYEFSQDSAKIELF